MTIRHSLACCCYCCSCLAITWSLKGDNDDLEGLKDAGNDPEGLEEGAANLEGLKDTGGAQDAAPVPASAGAQPEHSLEEDSLTHRQLLTSK